MEKQALLEEAARGDEGLKSAEVVQGKSPVAPVVEADVGEDQIHIPKTFPGTTRWRNGCRSSICNCKWGGCIIFTEET